MKDEARWVRWNAAEALGQIGDARAVVPLIDALKDGNPEVRCSAATALGNLGDERTVIPLISVLMDNDFVVRERAAEALGKIISKIDKLSELTDLKVLLVSFAKENREYPMEIAEVLTKIELRRNQILETDVAGLKLEKTKVKERNPSDKFRVLRV